MEELLYRCTVLYKKRTYELLLTPDRLVLHPSEGATSETETYPLTTVKSFVPNKPRPDLPQQKILLKLGFEAGAELVLDFQASAENQRQTEKILREFAGDRARHRQAQAAEEEQDKARRRAKFLHDRPALRVVYEALVENEKSLSPEDFWSKYDKGPPYDSDNLANSYGPPYDFGNILNSYEKKIPKPINTQQKITSEKKKEIFSQFPEAEKLYKSAVPDLVTESDFWRRFFSCQFFWKSQGRQRETTKDLLFDGLMTQTSSTVSRPEGYLTISPSLDLTADVLGHEGPPENPEEFRTLMTRFNQINQKRFPADINAETVEAAAEKRLRALEEELDQGPVEIAQVQKTELAKLLATYVEEKYFDSNVWKVVSEKVLAGEAAEKGTGANEVTMGLSQNLKNVEEDWLGEEKLDKAGKILMTSEFNKNFDIIAEQVNELLRHFWTTTDTVKRARILAALIRKRAEIENTLGKVPVVWAPSLKALLNAVDCAEKIARHLD